jgi:hypothetical protein
VCGLVLNAHNCRQHDLNTDNLLDGLELFQAYLHNVHDYIKQNPESKKNFDVQQITDSITGETGLFVYELCIYICGMFYLL